MTDREYNSRDVGRAMRSFYGLPDDTDLRFVVQDDGPNRLRFLGAKASFTGRITTDPSKVMREDIVSLRALVTEENRRRKEEHSEMLGRMKEALKPGKDQEIVGFDFSQMENRIIAKLMEQRDLIRRDTRNECKKLRIKGQEDGEDRREALNDDLKEAFSHVAKDLGLAVTGGCQKALDAQLGAMMKASKAVASKAAEPEARIELGTKIKITKPGCWFNMMGTIEARPHYTDGHRDGQYYVKFTDGGTIWLRGQELEVISEPIKHPLVAELIYGCLGRVSNMSKSGPGADTYYDIKTQRGDQSALKASVIRPLVRDLSCRCCLKPLVYGGRPTPDYDNARVLNTKALLSDDTTLVIARCGDCKLEGSYKKVDPKVVRFKQGLKLGDVVRDSEASYTGILREFVMFRDGEWGAKVAHANARSRTVPLTKLEKKVM